MVNTKPKLHDAVMTWKLPSADKAALGATANRIGISASALLLKALREKLNRLRPRGKPDAAK